MFDPAPAGATLNPARHDAPEIAPAYSPPSTPCDAAVKLTSPCCNSSAPPSSICSIKLTVVCPSTPVPPATCSVCAPTETADDGSLTTQVVGSRLGPRYSSSINAGLACANGFCER